jgi:hypothetical protein
MHLLNILRYKILKTIIWMLQKKCPKGFHYKIPLKRPYNFVPCWKGLETPILNLHMKIMVFEDY